MATESYKALLRCAENESRETSSKLLKNICEIPFVTHWKIDSNSLAFKPNSKQINIYTNTSTIDISMANYALI